MSLRCRKGGQAVGRSGGRWLPAGLALGALAFSSPADRPTARPPERPPVLRVCSDPNNLPFSNRAGEGFENRIAELVAGELHATVRYHWWPQRRGFVRNTLGAGRCDVIIGIPASDGQVLTTRPYYTSTYVFLSRRSSGLRIRSLDDPRLLRLRIGLHFIGDDYHNTPAAAALARRGIVRNLVGYSIYGDYSRPNPPARLIDAVARGEVDLAIVWGPFAGYFGPRTGVPLVSAPVTPAVDGPGLPFTFAIAAGVRRGDTVLQARVERALESARPRIREVLERYGVPLVAGAGAMRSSGARELAWADRDLHSEETAATAEACPAGARVIPGQGRSHSPAMGSASPGMRPTPPSIPKDPPCD